MKLVQRRFLDQLLASDEPCLGAAFCSYTFDPAYFEDHVLRVVLRLTGDPEEDSARYHEEARVALQMTPVACFVDATVRRAGRRLPYDLHLVRERTFHPKVYLVLFDGEARLAIGSGNLTKAGLEQNTELFFFRTLRYAEPGDAALLREVDAFLGHCAERAVGGGTQLPLIRQTLNNRLPPEQTDAAVPRDVAFVTTFGDRLLSQLDEAIAPSARITRIGVLAPFFEQDDLSVGCEQDGMHAVLAQLLALRSSSKASLDVGVPWDDAPLASPPSGDLPSLDANAGALWAWRRLDESDGKAERMEYFTLNSASAKRVEATNAAGATCRFDRAECEKAIRDHRLWPVSRPLVHAPARILQRIAAEYPVSLWLHPSSQLSGGQAQRRPLHAKAILVTASVGRKTYTYALLGSANASKAALDRDVDHAGNVEACVLCRLDGEVTLRDLLPALVAYGLDGVDLLEREALEAEVDLSAWIEDAVHDAAQRTLEVTWRDEGPAPLGDWELRYLDRSLAKGRQAPHQPTQLGDFDLGPTSAELTFVSAGHEWQVPIRVLDLAALPTNPSLTQLGLRELLALLGRRVGAERLTTLRMQRGVDGLSSVLDAVLGEGFGPTDVFKAWWGAMEDLQLAATVAAFRHRLSGPTGVLTVWQHLRAVPEDQLSPDEVWVYGCELLRELHGLVLPAGADTPSKQALMDSEIAKLVIELDQLAPKTPAHPWIADVRQFYGFGGGK